MALLRKKNATSRIFEVYHRVKIYAQVKTSPCSLNPDPWKPRKQKKHLRLKRSNALPSLKRKIQTLQKLHHAFNCQVKVLSINAHCVQQSFIKKLRSAATSRRRIPVNLSSTTKRLKFVTGESSFGSATTRPKQFTTLPSLKLWETWKTEEVK